MLQVSSTGWHLPQLVVSFLGATHNLPDHGNVIPSRTPAAQEKRVVFWNASISQWNSQTCWPSPSSDGDINTTFSARTVTDGRGAVRNQMNTKLNHVWQTESYVFQQNTTKGVLMGETVSKSKPGDSYWKKKHKWNRLIDVTAMRFLNMDLDWVKQRETRTIYARGSVKLNTGETNQTQDQ